MALPKENRLKKKADFDSVFKNGRSAAAAFLLLKFKTSAAVVSRAGVIVPLKISRTAVARNRLKRKISEVTASLIPALKEPLDLIIIVKSKDILENPDLVAKEMRQLFLKQNLLKQ